MMISLAIGTLPPSINHYYGVARSGRKWVSARGKSFRAVVAAAYRDGYPLGSPLTGELSVKILFQPATKRRMDIDNRIKPLLDACTLAGIWLDDSQIKHLEVRLLPPVRGSEACQIQVRSNHE